MNKCYICLEETEFKSPCNCQLYLCKECFKKLLKKKNEQCTICRSNYENKNILCLKNIELKRRNSPLSKSLIIDISEINISESDEDIEEEQQISNKNKIKRFIYCILFFILIVVLGNIMEFGFNIKKWIFDILIILLGFLSILLIILILEFIYCVYLTLCDFIKIFHSNIP